MTLLEYIKKVNVGFDELSPADADKFIVLEQVFSSSVLLC